MGGWISFGCVALRLPAHDGEDVAGLFCVSFCPSRDFFKPRDLESTRHSSTAGGGENRKKQVFLDGERWAFVDGGGSEEDCESSYAESSGEQGSEAD